MERLRRFLAAGVTCFVDLTQPQESPSYEALLPFANPDGRRVEYLRQPIPDHDVPEDRTVMERILVLVDDALAAGHVVYVHCRAGIGRSATVAGCWLATQRGDAEWALRELQELWKQSAQSTRWTCVPETEAQEEFVRRWLENEVLVPARPVAVNTGGTSRADRMRGAWVGLAVGDALGAARSAGSAGQIAFTQPTALALCLADSLVAKGRCDARDQIDRYVRWQREGLRSATGEPGQPSADIAKALGTYLWRDQPMSGSHDPKDRTTASLPRVVAAATFAANDPAAAIALAGECSRTTHQSPIVIDACRYLAAVVLDLIQGRPVEQALNGVPEPVSGCWDKKPLKREIVAMAGSGARDRSGTLRLDTSGDVLAALANMRAAVAASREFEAAVRLACDAGNDPALDGALAGALFGALHGVHAIPRERIAAVSGIAQVQSLAEQVVSRDAGLAA
jgi:ADP-ribosylglycohydrolase